MFGVTWLKSHMAVKTSRSSDSAALFEDYKTRNTYTQHFYLLLPLLSVLFLHFLLHQISA